MQSRLIFISCIMGLTGCLSLPVGTLPFLKIDDPMERKSFLNQNISFSNNPQPDTTMFRMCEPYINLMDSMTEAEEQEGLVGLRNFELYSTPEGLNEGIVRFCIKVRGVPVKAKK